MIEEVEVGKLKEIDTKAIRYKYHKSGNPIEEAEMIQQLLDQEFSQKDVAEMLEISQPQISRRLQLLKLHPTLQERLKSGDLRPTAAYDLSKLPMEVQEQYLNREKILVKDVKATRRKIIITADLQELLETRMEKSVDSEPFLEALAALEHEQWAHWTNYLLHHITEENVHRWEHQIRTPYEKLSEKEKESDLKWARKVLDLLKQHGLLPK